MNIQISTDSPWLSPFSAWVGPKDARTVFVGEAFGEQEDQTKQAFVGTSGQELWRMLGEALPDVSPDLHRQAMSMFRYGNAWIRSRRAWLTEASIALTNVFNLRPFGNKVESLCLSKKDYKTLFGKDPSHAPLSRGWYLRPEFLPHPVRLFREIALCRPNLVVALGNTACWATLGATNIGSIRGTVTLMVQEETGTGASGPPVKVLPTYHPAGVLRQWNWRPIVVADLMKAKRESLFLELRRPQRQVLVNPTLEEISVWVSQTLARPPQVLSYDIETQARQITCIGFARSPSEAMVVPFVDLSHPSGSYWPTPGAELAAWSHVKSLLESDILKVCQNGTYDNQYLFKMGFRPKNCTEDTMLLHHSLFPELRKGLGFLGSIYCDGEASWKLMRRPRPDTEKRDE